MHWIQERYVCPNCGWNSPPRWAKGDFKECCTNNPNPEVNFCKPDGPRGDNATHHMSLGKLANMNIIKDIIIVFNIYLVCTFFITLLSHTQNSPFTHVPWADKNGINWDGCERYRFVVGLDTMALPCEIGLYFDFNVTDDGVPFGCPGLEHFTPEAWNTSKYNFTSILIN